MMRQFVYLAVLSAAILVQGCGGGSTEPAPVQTQSVEKNPTTPDELRALPTSITQTGITFGATTAVKSSYATTSGHAISISEQAGFISVQANHDGVDWSQVQITGYAYNHNNSLFVVPDLRRRLAPSPSASRKAYLFAPSHTYTELAIRLQFPDLSERWLLTQKPDCNCNHFVLNPGGSLIGAFAQRVEPILAVGSEDASSMTATLATILFKQDGFTTRSDVMEGLFAYGERDKIIERRGFSLLDAKRYLVAKGYFGAGYRIGTPADIAVLLQQFNIGLIAFYSIEGISHVVWMTNIDENFLYLSSPYFGNVAVPNAAIPTDLVVFAVSTTSPN